MPELRLAVDAYLAARPIRGVRADDLADALSHGTLIDLKPGQIICSRGGQGHALFLLISGEVRVMGRDRRGQPRELATIGAPAMFGHVAVIDRSPRSATCVAAGSALVASLGRASTDRILAETSAAGTALRRVLCGSLCLQLGQANDQLHALMSERDVDDTVEVAAMSTLLGG